MKSAVYNLQNIISAELLCASNALSDVTLSAGGAFFQAGFYSHIVYAREGDNYGGLILIFFKEGRSGGHFYTPLGNRIIFVFCPLHPPVC